jgi:predicted ABC-type ATPase
MPNCFAFGGPNGAGKTTLALRLLPSLGVRHFVNADAIAAGLSPLDVSLAQFSAGRLMRDRLRELASGKEDFGFETTFASNSATKLLEELAAKSWTTHLIFVWLPSAEMAIERVAARVKAGGHYVEDATVRRRYQAGLQRLRASLLSVDAWTVFDNSGENYEMVARGQRGEVEVVRAEIWKKIVL